MVVASRFAGGNDSQRQTGARWLLLLFVLSLPLVTIRIYAADELQYFAPLRSLWKDGDLDYRNEYEHFLAGRGPDAPERVMLLGRTTPHGRAPSYATIGCALLWAPFFAAGDVVARIGGWPTDGFAAPYVAAVCLASALYGFLGLWLLYLLAARIVSPRAAFGAALLGWWATALPFYLYVTPPMSHATSLFAASLFVFLWARGDWTKSAARAAALGAAGGLATLVREQNALLLVLPGIALVSALATTGLRAGRELRRAARAAAALAAGFVLALVPQLLVWHSLFGRFAPASERLSFFRPWPRHLGDVLLSANHGLASWHPAWILGVAGLALLVRRRRDVALPLLAVFTTNLLFLGSVTNWAGGMAFGQRRLLECLFVVVLGGAVLLERLPRVAAGAVGALLVWWNLSLLVQFGAGMIPREGPVDWPVVAANQVTVVPARIGGVAWRYLVDRESLIGERSEGGQ